jgi:DNA-binding response OmpR family regulator
MPGHLLIVEDDDSIGRVLQASLSAHGYTVDWRSDVAASTELLGRTIPDLVLLDASLPDGDGFAFCRWLRSQQPDLPVVLVTARDDEIDLIVGLDAGATDYLTKPFSFNVLLGQVRQHLRVADRRTERS